MDLFQCILSNDLEQLKKLLRNDTDINAVDSSYWRNKPLHFAIENNKEEVVRELLQNKWNVDIDALNARGDTPLHVAARKGHYEFIYWLLRQQAACEVRNKEGMTFVDIIRKQGKENNCVLAFRVGTTICASKVSNCLLLQPIHILPN